VIKNKFYMNTIYTKLYKIYVMKKTFIFF